MARRSWLQRDWAPYAVIAATLAMACLDGAVRAQNGAMTLMGEDPAGHMKDIVAAGVGPVASVHAKGLHLPGTKAHQLHQNVMGEDCKFQYNCIRSLVCRQGQCATCESTSECQEHGAEMQCFTATEGETHSNCKHKPMFFPFSWRDGLLLGITLITITLTAPTGAGGGGILVPLFMFIGEFSPHTAVPLSKAAIVGGALTNNFLNLQHRHPFANRPLVDYEVLPPPNHGPLCRH